MKTIAFTCTACGALNIPMAGENWTGFMPCRHCGTIERVSAVGPERTAPHLYREKSRVWGLPIKTIFELQKRGLLPRDLAECTHHHVDIARAIALALGSEEILRAALATLPESRREPLLSAVPADGLLTAWQRYIVDRYTKEYREELHHNPPMLVDGRLRRFGGQVTGIAEMIRDLERIYRLQAATTRPWIGKLKKMAYNRVLREIKGPRSKKRSKREDRSDG